MKQSSQSKVLPPHVLSELHSGRPGVFQTQLQEARELCVELRLRNLSKRGYVVEPSQLPMIKASMLKTMPSILCPTLWYPELCPALSSIRSVIQKSSGA